MKKFLSLALAMAMVLSLAACGKKDEPAKSGSASGSVSTAGSTSTGTQSNFKVGAIYINSKNDTAGYTFAHHNGITTAMKELGLDPATQLVIVDEVPEDDVQVSNAVDILVGEGANIIFGISFNYMNALSAKAEEHPEVAFSHATGYMSNETNFNNYFGRIYQARYLSGIIAGMKTETNKIGYVAAMGQENGEVTSGCNAFAMGVASVNPDAEVYVSVTNSWFDPEGEKQAAERLIAEGCDVIGQHCDTPNPQTAAEEHGVWGVGYNSDMTKDAPGATLTSVMWDWSVYYTKAVQNVIDGTWVAGEKVDNYFGDMADGLVTLGEFNSDLVTDEMIAKVEEVKAQIVSGEWDVFDGKTEIMDNEGNAHTLEGADYGSCNWYYENVNVL